MLDEELKKLRPEDRAMLVYAFQNDQTQYVVLPGGYFVGVNVSHCTNLTITESKGAWAFGTIRR